MRIRTSGLWMVVALAACTDMPNEPRPAASLPPALNAAKGGVQGGNGKTSLDLIETDVAAGMLDKQNGNVYREAALSDPTKLPAKYQSSSKGKDATPSLVQMAKDWSSLSKSTQQQILDLRAKGLGQLSQSVATAHFILHYTTVGNHAVPLLDANRNGIPDFIDVAAQSVETVWHREIVELALPGPARHASAEVQYLLQGSVEILRSDVPGERGRPVGHAGSVGRRHGVHRRGERFLGGLPA